jgi:quercetin dioxygenase-like cupin family protein
MAVSTLSDAVFIRAADRDPSTVDRGVRRRMLGHGPDLMMVSVEFDAGAVGAMHNHPHRQVTYVASGVFRVTVDGRDETLRPGDSFYVAADFVHGVVALEAGTLIDVFTPARDDFLK